MSQETIRVLLHSLYGENEGERTANRLFDLLDRYRSRLPRRVPRLEPRDAILITYPDQVRDEGQPPLKTLADFCTRHLRGVVSGVHILPFFPWSSDDGFAVMDYRRVAPEYGDWDDVARLGEHFRLMFDAVINHISSRSEWFQAFLRDDPRYRDYFIVLRGDEDLSAVVRPRALPLVTRFQTPSGEKLLWTTFSADQIDLNYHNPAVLLEIVDILLEYVGRGAEFIRLDAIAYLWKEIGTSCIHLPQTHAVVRLFRAVLDEVAPHVMLITETNVPHAENISYFGDGTNEAQMVYNFALPPLVLHAFHTANAETLSSWAATLALPSDRATFFNFLASHDGIGLNPARGILRAEEIEALVRRTKAAGGLVSNKSDSDGGESPYELNINYFDALNAVREGDAPELQVSRFVTAHAILLSLIGVPGIYFHSLFGSRGWPEGVKELGYPRAINRQKLRRADLERELADPASRRARVFRQLAHLLRVRAGQEAFHPFGRQRILFLDSGVFAVLRTAPDGRQRALCLHNVTPRERTVRLSLSQVDAASGEAWRDLLADRPLVPADPFTLSLAPYQTRWLGLPSGR